MGILSQGEVYSAIVDLETIKRTLQEWTDDDEVAYEYAMNTAEQAIDEAIGLIDDLCAELKEKVQAHDPGAAGAHRRAIG